MDIGGIVNYEHIHTLRMTYPNSSRYVGITVGLRSASSPTAKAVIRKHIDDEFKATGRQKRYTAKDSELQELEKIASTIAWWKWEKSDPSAADKDDGEQANYKGSQPELTMSTAIEILDNVNWFYSQVKVAGADVENFMPALFEGAASS